MSNKNNIPVKSNETKQAAAPAETKASVESTAEVTAAGPQEEPSADAAASDAKKADNDSAKTDKKPAKSSRKAKKAKTEEAVPDVGEQPIRPVLVTNGQNPVISCISCMKDASITPVICRYDRTSGYGRGTEVYHAENEGQAKALLALLAEAEKKDLEKTGRNVSVFKDPSGLYAKVFDPTKPATASEFEIGTSMKGVSFDMDPAVLPAELQAMILRSASNAASPDATVDKRVQGLFDFLCTMQPLLAQFLSIQPDAIPEDKEQLRKMVSAQIEATPADIMEKWFELVPKEQPQAASA